jgi:hypothetical protein
VVQGVEAGPLCAKGLQHCLEFDQAARRGDGGEEEREEEKEKREEEEEREEEEGGEEMKRGLLHHYSLVTMHTTISYTSLPPSIPPNGYNSHLSFRLLHL